MSHPMAAGPTGSEILSISGDIDVAWSDGYSLGNGHSAIGISDINAASGGGNWFGGTPDVYPGIGAMLWRPSDTVTKLVIWQPLTLGGGYAEAVVTGAPDKGAVKLELNTATGLADGYFDGVKLISDFDMTGTLTPAQFSTQVQNYTHFLGKWRTAAQMDNFMVTSSSEAEATIDTTIYKYPIARGVTAKVSIVGIGASSVTLTISDDLDTVVAQTEESLDTLPVVKWLTLYGLENDASYTARVIVKNEAEDILAEDVIPFTMAPRPEWADADVVDAADEVLAPWTPVEMNGTALSCWGRIYDMGDSLLPVSISSGGEDILADRMSITVISGATTEVFDLAGSAPVVSLSQTGDKAFFDAAAQSTICDVSVSSSLEFDGFMAIDVTLTP